MNTHWDYMNKKVIIVILIVISLFTLSSCKKSHKHSLEKIDKVEALCEEDGNILYYVCSSCNKLFSDENAKNEITISDIVINKTGHQFDNDCDETCNNCTHERDVYHVDIDEDDICDKCEKNIWGDDSGVDLPIDKQ